MAKKVQPFERASVLPLHKIIFNNFIGGISWALGATIGISLIFTILTMIARNIDFVPFFGNFVSDIIDFVLKTNPKLGS